jgi:hypothetical protein
MPLAKQGKEWVVLAFQFFFIRFRSHDTGKREQIKSDTAWMGRRKFDRRLELVMELLSQLDVTLR